MDFGIDRFLKTEYKKFKNLSLGVVCNQASVDKSLHHISERILDKKLGLNINCFFGPQHGIRGEKQDNMIESDDFVDPVSKLKVHSLYGKYREPAPEMITHLDAFVIDLQDIGTRIYTFMYTMANCMRVAKKFNKKVIILDRPNPVNGVAIEGNTLELEWTSFVGQYPICVRHGMTMGELAHLFNEEFEIGCDLTVIPVKGWKRAQSAFEWDRPWIAPSPNIPVVEAAFAFPGGVYFEGTHISEGRGTTRPFEMIGAPFINADKLASQMNQKKLKGVYFRPIFFQPTFQKWKGETCGGVYVHIENPKTFNSFEMGMHLLFQIHENHPKDFQWKNPPYEYEFTKMPIDLIAGTSFLRECVEKNDLKSFLDKSKKELAQFAKIRKNYLIY